MSKKPDLETATRDELIGYIGRLETSRDDVRANNKEVTKFANKVNEAMTRLSSEASVVFQAMAEKAGVRGHPSVTQAVQLFDGLMHVQWQDKKPAGVEWPKDWDFDDKDDWSGDADMQLNAPIAALIELLNPLSLHRLPEGQWRAICEAVDRVEVAMRTHIQGIKSLHGFKKMTVNVKDAPRGIGMALLDLAQDMDFANTMLRRDLRAAVYRRVRSDLYALSHCEFEDEPSNIDIHVLGGDGPTF